MKKLVSADVKLTIPWNILVDADMSDEDICLKIQEQIFCELGLVQNEDDEPIIDMMQLCDIPEPDDPDDKIAYILSCEWSKEKEIKRLQHAEFLKEFDAQAEYEKMVAAIKKKLA